MRIIEKIFNKFSYIKKSKETNLFQVIDLPVLPYDFLFLMGTISKHISPHTPIKIYKIEARLNIPTHYEVVFESSINLDRILRKSKINWQYKWHYENFKTIFTVRLWENNY